MIFDQLAHLLLRELERVFKQLTVRIKDKLNHALWMLPSQHGVNENHGE